MTYASKTFFTIFKITYCSEYISPSLPPTPGSYTAPTFTGKHFFSFEIKIKLTYTLDNANIHCARNQNSTWNTFPQKAMQIFRRGSPTSQANLKLGKLWTKWLWKCNFFLQCINPSSLLSVHFKLFFPLLNYNHVFFYNWLLNDIHVNDSTHL